jgi:hypothetical protein
MLSDFRNKISDRFVSGKLLVGVYAGSCRICWFWLEFIYLLVMWNHKIALCIALIQMLIDLVFIIKVFGFEFGVLIEKNNINNIPHRNIVASILMCAKYVCGWRKYILDFVDGIYFSTDIAIIAIGYITLAKSLCKFCIFIVILFVFDLPKTKPKLYAKPGTKSVISAEYLDAWREVCRFIGPIELKKAITFAKTLKISKRHFGYIFSEMRITGDDYDQVQFLPRNLTRLTLHITRNTTPTFYQQLTEYIPESLQHLTIIPEDFKYHDYVLLYNLLKKCTNLTSLTCTADMFYCKLNKTRLFDNNWTQADQKYFQKIFEADCQFHKQPNIFQTLPIQNVTVTNFLAAPDGSDNEIFMQSEFVEKIHLEFSYDLDLHHLYENLLELHLVIQGKQAITNVIMPPLLKVANINLTYYGGDSLVNLHFVGDYLESFSICLTHSFKIKFTGFLLNQMSKLKNVSYTFLHVNRCDFKDLILPESVEYLQLKSNILPNEFYDNLPKKIRKLALHENPETLNWLLNMKSMEHFICSDYLLTECNLRLNHPNYKEILPPSVHTLEFTVSYFAYYLFLEISNTNIRYVVVDGILKTRYEVLCDLWKNYKRRCKLVFYNNF